jgi:hypothetical protein
VIVTCACAAAGIVMKTAAAAMQPADGKAASAPRTDAVRERMP